MCCIGVELVCDGPLRLLFELISGCGVLGRIPRILGPLSTLSLSYHRRLKLLGKQVSSHFSAETALYISAFEKVVAIILQ